VIACIALLIFFIIRLLNPTRVSFSPVNMSFDVGKGWKEVKMPAIESVSSPRLRCNFEGYFGVLSETNAAGHHPIFSDPKESPSVSLQPKNGPKISL
jgi:hypothetical protein